MNIIFHPSQREIIITMKSTTQALLILLLALTSTYYYVEGLPLNSAPTVQQQLQEKDSREEIGEERTFVLDPTVETGKWL